MSENTKIEWADHSWSPWRGCTKVSAGCANCYAETLSKRNPAVLGQWGKGNPRVLAKNWNDPVKWNRSGHVCADCGKATFADRCGRGQCRGVTHIPRVFPSLCDWLDDEVPIEWLARFLQLIHDTPNLDWLLLTKRPENFVHRIMAAALRMRRTHEAGSVYWREWLHGYAPQNVWIGTSVEDQANADRRIPALLKIPAMLRFLSVEPMLRPIDLMLGRNGHSLQRRIAEDIHWVIFGGESGHGARPCNVEWIREGVKQCAAAGVQCFVKQLGAHPVGRWTASPEKAGLGEGWPAGLKITHPKGGDPDEWPEDLRVRQMGNAVPVGLARALAREYFRGLS